MIALVEHFYPGLDARRIGLPRLFALHERIPLLLRLGAK